MADWAHAFNCKVYLPVADSQWVTEPGDYIEFWSGKPFANPCAKKALGDAVLGYPTAA